MADLLSLAERCEKARGPSKALDDAIAEALELQPSHFERRKGRCFTIYPRVTASLDAAMTLVPEEMVWSLDVYADHTEALVRHLYTEGEEHRAATPALALCAASLRAIHHRRENGE